MTTSFKDKVWIVTGTTESGDDWRLVFKNQPSDDDIVNQLRADPWLLEEFEAECINGWDINEETIID